MTQSDRIGQNGAESKLTAKDILDQHVKFKELDDLTQRIEAIEERLTRSGDNPQRHTAP